MSLSDRLRDVPGAVSQRALSWQSGGARFRLAMVAGAVIVALVVAAARADAAGSPPTGACTAVTQAVARHWPAGTHEQAVRIAWRESGCGRVLHAYRKSTRDNSYGPFMLNRWGKLAGYYERAGFSASYMATVDGGTATAAWLYRQCGWGPWVKPYSCRKPG